MTQKSVQTPILQSLGAYILDNPAFSAWAGSMALATCLSLVGGPNVRPVASGLATGLLGAGVGVTVAKQQNSKALRAAQIDKSRFESEQRQLKQEQEALSRAQNDLRQAEAKLTAFQAQLKTESNTYKDRIQVEEHRKAQAEAQKLIDSMQAKLEAALADKAAVVGEYTTRMGEVTDTAKKVVAAKKEHVTKLTAAAEKAIDTRDQVLIDERGQVNGVLERLSREINVMAKDLAAQKELVAKLQAPKDFPFRSLEADTGNAIRQFLHQRGIILSCDRIGKVHYGSTPIFFEPITCDGLKSIEPHLDALHLVLGLAEVPKVAIEQGKIKITVQLSQEKIPKRSPIRHISIGEVEKALLQCFHLRVSGFTGSGKSVMLNNLIGLFESDMGSKAIIFDPKVDFPSAQYPKNRVYRGPKRCIENIDLIGDVVTVRQESKVQNDERGIPIPELHQQPRLFLMDEVKDIYNSANGVDEQLPPKERLYAKAFKRSVQKGLEVGRGLKVRVIFSTVTDESSDFGFKNNVFKQSATIYLGNQAITALDGEYLKAVTSEKKAQLKLEYKARQDAGQEYIALFYNGSTNEVFYFESPPPATWDRDAVVPKTSSANPLKVDMLAQVAQGDDQLGQVTKPLSEQMPQLSQDCQAVSSSPSSGLTSAQELAQRLKAGTQCPECGTHNNTYKSKVPTKAGLVRVRCKNKNCSTDVFKWAVLPQVK